MRTDEEQEIGLNIVAGLAAREGTNIAVVHVPGDVTIAHAVHEGWPTVEVVYASGGYDVWRAGRLDEPDVSAEVAAQALIDDYRRMKSEYIARHK